MKKAIIITISLSCIILFPVFLSASWADYSHVYEEPMTYELPIECRALGNCSEENREILDNEYKQQDIIEEIYKQAREYFVDPEDAIRIAKCESTFNPHAKNPNSTAKGVYQFLDGTWEWINASGHQFDYKENIKQFMIWYPVYPSWWECR